MYSSVCYDCLSPAPAGNMERDKHSCIIKVCALFAHAPGGHWCIQSLRITHAYRRRLCFSVFLLAHAIECCRSCPVRQSWLTAASSEHPKAQTPSTNVAFTAGRLSLLPCNLCSKLPSNTVKSALIPTLHAKQVSHMSHSSFVWPFLGNYRV